MTMLKYPPEHNRKTTAKRSSEKRIINNKEDLIDLFPLPRYFQVHFDHIHDKTDAIEQKINHVNQDLCSQLEQLKQSLGVVENKLDLFFAILHNQDRP